MYSRTVAWTWSSDLSDFQGGNGGLGEGALRYREGGICHMDVLINLLRLGKSGPGE